MKPIKKAATSKNKSPKTPRSGAAKPRVAGKEPRADGPDEQRPGVGADEIYGDTQIPKSHRK